MEEDIQFLDKEIQRLEEISKKTYYRLAAFRRIRKNYANETEARKNTAKITQLTFFGT